MRRNPTKSPHSQVAWGALVGVALMLTTSAFAIDLRFPPLTGRVVDDAGLLSAPAKSELDAMLAQHESTSHQQFVVVTLSSLQSHSIEDYGYQLGRYWGIGQKGKNNGVILIVAPNEHKVRIEVGYGLEGQLTDAASRVIIENYITPQFRKGDFDTGVMAGTAAILRALGDDAAANLHSEAQPVAQAADNNLGSFPPVFFLIFFVIVIFLIMRRNRFPDLMRHGGGPYLGSGGGFGGGSFGGGSSDGSGFSGGGGSFGGGGASGSW
jgi:uncharacterized protein